MKQTYDQCYSLHFRNDCFFTSVQVCEQCQAVITYLQSIFVTEVESQRIDNLVEELCKLAGGFNITCSALIAEYITDIAEIINSTNPTSLCRAIYLCKL
ncbi:hypothetical protein EWB00_010677 [Schistosoma japonicum]|uniref:Saposin B-type domain-containing protein n=1 Tax=Schistosoma japonicum TaxID=6182 RepID=A0A4Z2DN88_SCHJA|nr:hypothetical protein KSF78_0007310 [Schistosoma japonicum]TNN17985.1 hypothetical protein EWB00_010677 [Schistosoma japonicum]